MGTLNSARRWCLLVVTLTVAVARAVVLSPGPNLGVELNDQGRITGLSVNQRPRGVLGIGGWEVTDLARGRDVPQDCPIPAAVPADTPLTTLLAPPSDDPTQAPATPVWRFGSGWLPADGAVACDITDKSGRLELVVPVAAAMRSSAAFTVTLRLRGTADESHFRLGIVPVSAVGQATSGWVSFEPSPDALAATGWSERVCRLFPPPTTAGLLVVIAPEEPGGTLSCGGAGIVTHLPGPVTTFEGAVTATAQGGTFSSTADGLTLNVVYQSDGGAVRVNATLASLTDRAVCLALRLPLDGAGWDWWDDLRRHSVIPATSLRTYAAWRHVGGGHLFSPWPFGCLTRETPAGGLAMAAPLRADVPWRYAFRQEDGLSAACDIGLAPQQGHASAELELAIYPVDAAWGMRSALARYQELFPLDSVASTSEHGAWFTGVYPDAVKAPRTFGLRFDEQADDHPDWTNNNKLRAMRLIQPWAVPAAEGGAAPVGALVPPGGHPVALRDPLGHAWWPVVSAPADAAAEGRAGYVIDGLGADWTGWELELADRALWPKVTAPLSASRTARQPVLLAATLRTEQLRALAERYRPQGALLLGGPDARIPWPYVCPWLDVLGGGERVPPLDFLSWLRALSPTKPITFLEPDLLDPAPVVGSQERIWHRAVLGAAFPGLAGCFTTQAAETHLTQFETFVPLLRELAAGGWQAVPQVRTSDAVIELERYGSGARTSVVLRNPSAKERGFTLTLWPFDLELAALAEGHPVVFRDVLAAKQADLQPTLEFDRWRLNMALAPGQLAILRPQGVAVAGSGAKPVPERSAGP